MLIDHDVRCSLDLAVDLLNSGPAALADLAALRAFVVGHAISDVEAEALDAGDLAAVRRVRQRFAEIFAAPTDRAAAELVNGLVAAAGTTPRLTDHDGHAWHVHYFAPGASIADHLAADCGMALGFFLVAGERERLRHCAAPGCGRAFVDLSRNRSRRYCSNRTCGNRLHVAAYRARRRGPEREGRSEQEVVVHPRDE
ncbi:CGNR zinc finger domain-containing protein [Streptomyces millisiae]|uniref:CGNR zinc finger domain-containing protein n=1 Tax=Streptomyces millisiae TaxID=3075542 RepID=A0ABU2LT56_9ACTN|nr:CGNR zinc finger domain-containing protein [Streptomyces sp. DSM 44918]MDT0320716.1 CGNR zinc finger domain-containing protein [Streptomyces sp. DSM 44918]